MKNVLCIDDSRSVHAFFRSCIADQFNITSVFNGPEALAMLKEKSFDLIFLDWEMPQMNGPEVYDKIREIKVATPIIMVTSKNDHENISQMLSKGASEYVLKPFTKDILVEKINSVLLGY